jgi:hypothetical protein
MANGNVSIRVRPLRVAFLVDPRDTKGLRRAIELSTFQWGGTYNPIIPVFQRIPKIWEPHRGLRVPSSEQVIEGYLTGFDPDIVVPVGTCGNRVFDVGHRELVSALDLMGDMSASHSPKFGIGYFELFSDFIDKELKFVRSDNLRLVLPKLPRQYGLFLASVFGALPPEVGELVDSYYDQVSALHRHAVKLTNYTELLEPHEMFPRRLNTWGLEHRPVQELLLYVCDATSTLDVIDYWNLRAAGYQVVPIPIQSAHSHGCMELARNVISEGYQPRRHQPDWFHRVTVQRSRAVSEKVVEHFCLSLQLPQGKVRSESKYLIRHWYPRIWDSWARENTQEKIQFPYSHEIDLPISEGETRMELRAQQPTIKRFGEYTGEPKFANDFSFRFYGSKEPMAEVLPYGSRELSTAIGRIGYFNWRFSESGPVYLATMSNDLIFLELPKAQSVMTEWLRERGWEVGLSTSGRMATQLVKQLGGAWGISSLARVEVIKLLRDLEKEGGLSFKVVVGKLKAAIGKTDKHFKPEGLLKRLIEIGALLLGVNVQCPSCTRHNWYVLDALKYKVPCKFCLSNFELPLYSPPDIAWTYRAHGPFASSNAQGAFTVLLLLRFLSGTHDRGVTPLFSYTAKKDSKELEADLTCLYRPSTWRSTPADVVHAECKTFNTFEKADFERMSFLAEEFPGCVLVFASLKTEINQSEAAAIRSFVQTQRRRRLRRQPSSHVVVLTGTELLSERGAPSCWAGKGELQETLISGHRSFHDLAVLADATQQIYLGMPGWLDWSESERAKKHARKSAKP